MLAAPGTGSLRHEMRVTLDATERKALTLAAFTAACICFAPAQIISGVLMLVVAGIFYRWDRKATEREEAQREAAPPPAEETETSASA